MRIRGRQVKLNPVNPYSAAAEWAATVQRTAKGSNEPTKSATGVEGISSPGEASVLANWMDALYSQTLTVHALSSPEYQIAAAGKDSSFA